jgi:NAD(P)-dependent dehydrogenase (short-subunit alcohol dehydrogenase family)
VSRHPSIAEPSGGAPGVSPTEMLIASGTLARDALAGKTVVVTGAGHGIGFEAARSLLWLGANVAIAEIDEAAGREAEARLAAEFAADRVLFLTTDVANEDAVDALVAITETRLGPIDVVLNNATFAPAGMALVESCVDTWDRSYAVNLRGPVLLARACLPGMMARGHGIFVCVSSTGGPYLAPYETLKAAQLALANSLDAELEGTGVTAFTIGPGLVPTDTAIAAIERVAPRLGMSVPAFWEMNRGAVVTVEAAGAGFAAAVALAERYAGQEISSTQALVDAGVNVESSRDRPSEEGRLSNLSSIVSVCQRVRATLAEQSAGWKDRSFFERQWMLRDFKQRAGMPVERWLETLGQIEERLSAGSLDGVRDQRPALERLAAFYGHLGDLARGYVKDPRQRDEQLELTAGWKADVERLIELLRYRASSSGPI